MTEPEHDEACAALVYSDCAISRLSDDILPEIFLHIRDISLPEVFDGKPGFSWLPSVTHVCRHWRNMAVFFPLLWAHIIVYPQAPELLSLFLERSADLRLNVYAIISGYDSLAELEMEKRILTSSPRIRSVELRLPSSPARSDLDWIRRESFPELQKLLVSRANNDYQPTLPMFFDTMDGLQELWLRNYCLPANLSVFKGLTKLRFKIWGHYDFVDFLYMLAGQADGPLEELVLWGNFPDAYEVYHDDPSYDLPSFPYSISLPRLQRLFIRGTGVGCAVILRHMTIPQIRTTRLCLEGCKDFEDDLHPVLSSIGQTVMSSTEEILSLDVAWSSTSLDGILISPWTTLFPLPSFFELLHAEGPETRLQYNTVEYPTDVVISTLHPRPGLPLHNLKMLSLTHYPSKHSHIPLPDPLNGSLLSTLFRQLPSIEILSVSSYMTLGLFEALAPTSADSDGCTLPLLKILNVGVSGTDYITGSTGRIGRVCIPLLIDSLHARAAVSHALELLRIASNYFRILDEEQVEKVRGCASMVRVACHSHMDDDIVFKE